MDCLDTAVGGTVVYGLAMALFPDFPYHFAQCANNVFKKSLGSIGAGIVDLNSSTRDVLAIRFPSSSGGRISTPWNARRSR